MSPNGLEALFRRVGGKGRKQNMEMAQGHVLTVVLLCLRLPVSGSMGATRVNQSDHMLQLFHALLRPNTCRVHGGRLEAGSAPIRYGLIRLDKQYLRAQKTSFPNAKSFLLGGCRVGTHVTADVRFCPECRKAREAWCLENPQFNRPGPVFFTVQRSRRDLLDSPGKRALCRSQLSRPEPQGEFP
jgi:hypothetical protein